MRSTYASAPDCSLHSSTQPCSHPFTAPPHWAYSQPTLLIPQRKGAVDPADFIDSANGVRLYTKEDSSSCLQPYYTSNNNAHQHNRPA